MTLESAKVIIEVTAGLIPGTPEDAFTRRWAITSAEWEEAQAKDAELLQQAQEGDADAGSHAMFAALLLAFRAAEADEYARLLRNPQRLNWTRTDWIWL
jgi:hypothetical protein